MPKIYLVVCLEGSEYVNSDIFNTKKEAIHYMIVNYGFEKDQKFKINYDNYDEAVDHINKVGTFHPESGSEYNYVLEEKNLY